jgi:hypothetical protein
MPVRRKLASWSASIILGASLLLAIAQQHSPPAQAQDATQEAAATDPSPDAPTIGPFGAQRFSLAPSDPGSVPYSALSDPEKEATDVAASIHDAETPPEAVAGWSAISQQYAEQAAVRRAEYEAGLAGISTNLGVE